MKNPAAAWAGAGFGMVVKTWLIRVGSGVFGWGFGGGCFVVVGAAAAGFAGFGVGGDEWEFVLDGLGVDGGFLSFHDFDDLLDFRGGCCGCGFVEEVGDGFDDWGGGDDGGSGGERG